MSGDPLLSRSSRNTRYVPGAAPFNPPDHSGFDDEYHPSEVDAMMAWKIKELQVHDFLLV